MISDGDSIASSSHVVSDDEGQDSSFEESSALLESSNSSGHEEREVQQLIRKESKDVALWREIVTGMMVITGALVTIATFVVFSRFEVNDFSDGVTDLSGSIIESANNKIEILLESVSGLSDVMTSFAMATNESWPLVTLPDFDIHVEHVREITGIAAMWSSPIVVGSTLGTWEAYSVELSGSEIWREVFTIENRTVSSITGDGPFSPVWQLYPSPTDFIDIVKTPVNYDILSDEDFQNTFESVNNFGFPALSAAVSLELFSRAYGRSEERFELEGPQSFLLQPVYDSFKNQTLVAYLTAVIQWGFLFENVLRDDQQGIVCVMKNTCGQEFTWSVNGKDVLFEGVGDLHDEQYAKYLMSTTFQTNANQTEANAVGVCLWTLDVYPTYELRHSFTTNKPLLYTSVIGFIFFCTAFTFFAYDKFVQRRNDKVVSAAARSNAIVSSLFPSNVRKQLFAESHGESGKQKGQHWLHPKSGLKNFLEGENIDNDGEEPFVLDTKPIADLFPETTIMFADLVGFTAWSSVREPSQVFTLLETVYRAFDQIAKRRRIFKVETVGDCYVAVSGLPEPRKDHALAMAKFASDCLKKLGEVTKKLETTLGPDTADLTVRVGLHSGPVTAGVLRGEKSRFQLFGDTMNTAARMESTGIRNKIQLSQETADLLIAAGKSHWVKPREEKIVAKGKGELQTYWLYLRNHSDRSSANEHLSSNGSSRDTDDDHDIHINVVRDAMEDPKVKRLMGDKTSRLIDWNVDVLLRLLKTIVARRQASAVPKDSVSKLLKPLNSQVGKTVIDEVVEIVTLPDFDAKAARKQSDPEGITIDERVVEQLHEYVTNVAIMYNENPFHNFEHASHVTMSVTKLLSRIVAPSDVLDGLSDNGGSGRGRNRLASNLHDHTYGITSDPLTQFACVFSALIHDVDHSGVPNTTLVKENAKIAAIYHNKSVAEQNSIDLAWDLLIDDSYAELRNTIYATQEEQLRFRQLVVNSVMATDIMDKDLKGLRNARWERAFDVVFRDENPRDAVNRKATIVIEHLIQASDVAHTMQHWHIYRKWNERLFCEMYLAYQTGRSETDPSSSWYKGELGFFDFYIIPLAKKLKDCGVFGVSSDEYLQYATVNRKEWEMRGEAIVAEMVEGLTAKANGLPATAPTPILNPQRTTISSSVAA